MEKNKYFAYYNQADVKITGKEFMDGGYYGKILGVNTATNEILVDNGTGDSWIDMEKTKLVLRPMTDMNNNELVSLVRLRTDLFLFIEHEHTNELEIDFSFEYASSGRRRYGAVKFRELSPRQMQYLIEKEFDIFNLIEKDFAVDKTTIKHLVNA